MLADTHVHLNHPDLQTDLEDVLDRARAAGVGRFLVPGFDLESSRSAVALARRHPGVQAAVGVHPHDARTYDDGVEAALVAWVEAGDAVAIGETGLDYHYDNSPREDQRRALRRHLRLARRYDLPVVLHNRSSDEDLLRILGDEAEGLRLVLHAFTGSEALMALATRPRTWFGIGGFLTFKKHPLAARVPDLPRERLVLETDAPYLSPHPFRGRRNEPARVAVIADRLAALLGLDREVLEATTTSAVNDLLGPG